MFHFSYESHLKIDRGIMAGQSPVIIEYGILDNFQDLNQQIQQKLGMFF